MLTYRTSLAAFLGLLTLTLAGCQEEQIQRYQAPKPTAASPTGVSPTRPAGPTPTRGRPRFTKPESWREAKASVQMSVATFQVGDGPTVARITVTPLGGMAGGLAANVNRWRGQLGLDRVSDEQVERDLRSLDVAGVAAAYADLTGPEAAGPKRERILGVAVPHGGQTWFIKMQGPADLVAKEQPAFEAFAKSLRFDDGPGANP